MGNAAGVGQNASPEGISAMEPKTPETSKPPPREYPKNPELIYENIISNSPLQKIDILSRASCTVGQVVVDDRTLEYGTVCFRGYYPHSPDKNNQDSFLYLEPKGICKDASVLFGVFDGHGEFGDQCAQFCGADVGRKLQENCKIKFPQSEENMIDDEMMKEILTTTFIDVNEKLHEHPSIDDTMSGTTAITAFFIDGHIWVANVGDSRCVVFRENDKMELEPCPLSVDQTPYRKDERARCRDKGARILNMDQIDGMEEVHDDWDVALGDEIDEEGNPPRIWHQHEDYPGVAFTRSVGDAVAEELGVFAEPEIHKHRIEASDRFLVIATDGVWEFLTNKAVGEIAVQARSAYEAACLLWRASYKEWISKEYRTDDITVTVVDISGIFATERTIIKRDSLDVKEAVTKRGSIANQDWGNLAIDQTETVG